VREIEIVKLRGTKLVQSNYMFTLDGGFHILPPFTPPKYRKVKKWRPIPDSATHFSTGSKDLDRVLGGGFPKGAYVILEVDANVPHQAIHLLEFPLVLNFLSQRRGVCIIPSSGYDSEELRRLITPFIGEAIFDKYARVYEEIKPGKDQTKPYIALVRGGSTNLERDAAAWSQTQLNLTEMTKQPTLLLVDFATLESIYAENPERLFHTVGTDILECKAQGNLTLAVARPRLTITRRALNMVDNYIRLAERNGCIFLYGVKPRTPLYAVSDDLSEGYPVLSLKLMI